jgi:hypothetical protein
MEDFTERCQILDSNNTEQSQLENFYMELKYMSIIIIIIIIHSVIHACLHNHWI